MITDIEKQFFETFGIKPRSYLLCTSCWDCIDAQPCEQCHYGKLIEDEYPKITDHILLKLICILTCHYLDEREPYEITSINMEQLKQQVLSDMIRIAGCEATKCQVQKIFKEI